jgi:uncharacterized protein YjiS (DUF1127 family)
MSVYETNRNVPLGAVTTFRLISSVERLIENVSKWRSARATATALSELSNAQLADIGVLRGEIDDVADRLVRRR